MKEFNVRGKTYHLIGRVNEFRKVGGEEQLSRLGSRPTTLIQSDFAIVGEGGGKKLEMARRRGIQELSEQEALTALAQEGIIALESSTIEQVIGELRGLLARTELSDADRWLYCADILDQCDEDHLDTVVNYISGTFVQTVRAAQKWIPKTRKHRLMCGVTPKWDKGLPKKELFVAPPGWVNEMLVGRYHKGHTLVRAINLDYTNPSRDRLRALLKNPHLHHVTFFNFGRRCPSPGELLAELDQLPSLHHVEEIWLYDFEQMFLKYFAQNKTALKHVKKIVFHGCEIGYGGHVYYGTMGEEEGLAMIEKITQLPCFDTPPEISFRSVKGR